MKYIEVKEFDPGVGQEYIYTNYPGQGAYLNHRSKMLMVIYTIAGTATLSGCSITSISADLIKEGKPDAAPTSVSEDFILKALAIAQNPALARELLING